MRETVKAAVKRLWSASLYGKATERLDQLLVALPPVDRTAGRVEGVMASSVPGVMVIAPSGRGNIGDQAMLDSILYNVDGPLTLVVANAEAFRISAEDRARVTLLVLPHLIRGLPHRRIPDLRTFAQHLQHVSLLLMPGADTMDGGHPQASLNRISLLHLAHRCGVRTAVLGFSWSDDAPVSVVGSMREASRYAQLCPRDPVTVARLKRLKIHNITPAADLVFTYMKTEQLPSDIAAWIEKDAYTPYVLLNSSGLIRRKRVLDEEYSEVLETLHGHGYRVIFLPHVIREPDNDLQACRILYNRFAGPQDLLVEQLLTPAQIQSLTSQAALSVTGRMHLAIMSLSQGTFPLTMSTAGKVDGLYRLFGLDFGVIQPQPGCGRALVDAIKRHVCEAPAISRQIQERLPEVRELSARNWEILEATD